MTVLTPRFPRWLNGIIIGLGLAMIFWHVPSLIPASTQGAVTMTKNGTEYVTTVRTVKRIVKGRIHTLPGHQVVVHVPLIIVRTHHRVIRVPAHDVPLRSAGAAVALPNIPITVYVTVPLDEPPLVVTSTVTVESTVTVPTTITVTLPLSEGTPDS